MYPAVGLKTYKETVALNFNGPFKYDIDNHVRNVRDVIWRAAMRNKVEDVPRLVDQLEPPPSPSLAKALDKSADESNATSSKGSLIQGDACDKTSAALVLDHLAHAGWTSTLARTEKEMTRRKWISNPTQPSSDSQPPPKPADLQSDPSISDFPSVQASIEWLYTRLTTAQKSYVPWNLLNQLFPELPPSFERFLKIHDFSVQVHKLISSPSPSSSSTSSHGKKDKRSATDGDLQVIAAGRELLRRCKVEKWNDEQETHLREIFTVFGAPSAQPSITRTHDLEEIAGKLVHDIRRELVL